MLCAVTAIPLLFTGACVRVVDEDSVQGERRMAEPLRPLPSIEGDSERFVYAWEDSADLLPGTTYLYWVEDVDIHGRPPTAFQIPV
jgi:hypothetical protein